MKNINYLISLFSNQYYLDSIEDEADEENNSYSIPYSLVQEKNAVNRFYESIKHCIRHSIEYTDWVKWFHEKYAPAICSVSDNTQTIEVHHHPLVLEDYVDFALAYIYENDISYTSNLVADIVIRWHYADCVGGCFMSKTYHQRFHKKHDITIPEDKIHWNFENFINDNFLAQYIKDIDITTKIVNYMPSLISKYSNIFNIKNNNEYGEFIAPE